MDSALLAQFDLHISRKGYTHRSEAMRALIRDSLDQAQREARFEETLRAMTVVYNQQAWEPSGVLGHLKHGDCKSIISTPHIPTHEHNCLEVLILPSSFLQGVNVGPDKVYNFRKKITPRLISRLEFSIFRLTAINWEWFE